MKRIFSVLAFAAAGALVASAGADAAQAGNSARFQQTAAVMSPMGLAASGGPRDVIDPPSSVDPGMALDPPQTGARMPVFHPPGIDPEGRLILPR
jgi:hypothetical protein